MLVLLVVVVAVEDGVETQAVPKTVQPIPAVVAVVAVCALE
jgi:hypothetical protein